MTEPFEPTPFYRKNVEENKAFEDLISDVFQKVLGLELGIHVSSEYQHVRGESRSGIEVKHDRIMGRSGNLCVEVSERAKKGYGWLESGVNRDAHTWLIAFADLKKVYVLSKLQLLVLANSGRYPVQEAKHGTSKFFLLPIEDAKRRHLILLEIDIPPDMVPDFLREREEQTADLFGNNGENHQ